MKYLSVAERPPANNNAASFDATGVSEDSLLYEGRRVEGMPFIVWKIDRYRGA